MNTMRLAVIVSLSASISGCQFIQVAPVPGVVLSQRPPTSVPISTASTQEVCVLRLEEGGYANAMDELNARGIFTDFEIAQIRAARVAVGMREDAVQCAIGRPSRILTRALGDEYDKAYDYDRPFMGVQTRVFFSDGVVARAEDYPRTNL